MILNAGIATMCFGALTFLISEWLYSRSNSLGRLDYVVWQRYCDWSDRARIAAIAMFVASLALFVAMGLK